MLKQVFCYFLNFKPIFLNIQLNMQLLLSVNKYIVWLYITKNLIIFHFIFFAQNLSLKEINSTYRKLSFGKHLQLNESTFYARVHNPRICKKYLLTFYYKIQLMRDTIICQQKFPYHLRKQIQRLILKRKISLNPYFEIKCKPKLQTEYSERCLHDFMYQLIANNNFFFHSNGLLSNAFKI